MASACHNAATHSVSSTLLKFSRARTVSRGMAPYLLCACEPDDAAAHKRPKLLHTRGHARAGDLPETSLDDADAQPCNECAKAVACEHVQVLQRKQLHCDKGCGCRHTHTHLLADTLERLQLSTAHCRRKVLVSTGGGGGMGGARERLGMMNT